MKIKRSTGTSREPLYDDVKQGDVFEVVDGLANPPRIWLRTSIGLINLDTGTAYNGDYLPLIVRVRIYPNATLVLEP